MLAWKKRLTKNWVNTRLAHEAVAIDRTQQQANLVQRLVRKTQNGTLGEETVEPEDIEGMGVAVGNETHNHYYPAAAGLLPKVVLISALIASGVVAGVFGAWMMRQPATPVVESPSDEHPQYDVGLRLK